MILSSVVSRITDKKQEKLKDPKKIKNENISKNSNNTGGDSFSLNNKNNTYYSINSAKEENLKQKINRENESFDLAQVKDKVGRAYTINNKTSNPNVADKIIDILERVYKAKGNENLKKYINQQIKQGKHITINIIDKTYDYTDKKQNDKYGSHFNHTSRTAVINLQDLNRKYKAENGENEKYTLQDLVVQETIIHPYAFDVEGKEDHEVYTNALVHQSLKNAKIYHVAAFAPSPDSIEAEEDVTLYNSDSDGISHAESVRPILPRNREILYSSTSTGKTSSSTVEEYTGEWKQQIIERYSGLSPEDKKLILDDLIRRKKLSVFLRIEDEKDMTSTYSGNIDLSPPVAGENFEQYFNRIATELASKLKRAGNLHAGSFIEFMSAKIIMLSDMPFRRSRLRESGSAKFIAKVGGQPIKFGVNKDWGDDESYSVINTQGELFAQKIFSRYENFSPQERQQILSLLQKNGGIEFKIHLLESDKEDDEYNYKYHINPRDNHLTLKQYIQRAVAIFSEKAKNYIEKVKDEGHINIDFINMNASMVNIIPVSTAETVVSRPRQSDHEVLYSSTSAGKTEAARIGEYTREWATQMIERYSGLSLENKRAVLNDIVTKGKLVAFIRIEDEKDLVSTYNGNIDLSAPRPSESLEHYFFRVAEELSTQLQSKPGFHANSFIEFMSASIRLLPDMPFRRRGIVPDEPTYFDASSGRPQIKFGVDKVWGDDESYGIVNTQGELLAQKILDRYAGFSEEEKQIILEQIQKNGGIFFKIHLLESDKNDNEYNYEYSINSHDHPITLEEYVKRAVNQFSEKAKNYIQNVKDEGHINIDFINMNASLVNVLPVRAFSVYPERHLKALDITDKNGEVLHPSSPNWVSRLSRVFSGVTKEINDNKGDFTRSPTLFEAAKQLVVANRGATAYQALSQQDKSTLIFQAQKDLMKSYYKFAAYDVHEQQRRLLAARPQPMAYLADELGEFLGIRKQDRIKLLNKVVSWNTVQDSVVPGPQGTAVPMHTGSQFRGNWVQLLLNQNAREHLGNFTIPNATRNRIIQELKQELTFEEGKEQQFNTNIGKLFHRSGLVLDDSELPDSLQHNVESFDAVYTKYKQDSIKKFAELESRKLIFESGDLEKIQRMINSLKGGEKFDYNSELSSTQQATVESTKNFVSEYFREREELDKLHDMEAYSQRALVLAKQVFSTLSQAVLPIVTIVAPELLPLFMLGSVLTTAGLDIAMGNKEGIGHDFLEGVAATLAFTPIPGAGLISAGLFLADAVWSGGESVEELVKAIESGDARRISAAIQSLFENIGNIALSAHGVYHSAIDLTIEPTATTYKEGDLNPRDAPRKLNITDSEVMDIDGESHTVLTNVAEGGGKYHIDFNGKAEPGAELKLYEIIEDGGQIIKRPISYLPDEIHLSAEEAKIIFNRLNAKKVVIRTKYLGETYQAETDQMQKKYKVTIYEGKNRTSAIYTSNPEGGYRYAYKSITESHFDEHHAPHLMNEEFAIGKPVNLPPERLVNVPGISSNDVFFQGEHPGHFYRYNGVKYVEGELQPIFTELYFGRNNEAVLRPLYEARVTLSSEAIQHFTGEENIPAIVMDMRKGESWTYDGDWLWDYFFGDTTDKWSHHQTYTGMYHDGEIWTDFTFHIGRDFGDPISRMLGQATFEHVAERYARSDFGRGTEIPGVKNSQIKSYGAKGEGLQLEEGKVLPIRPDEEEGIYWLYDPDDMSHEGTPIVYDRSVGDWIILEKSTIEAIRFQRFSEPFRLRGFSQLSDLSYEGNGLYSRGSADYKIIRLRHDSYATVKWDSERGAWKLTDLEQSGSSTKPGRYIKFNEVNNQWEIQRGGLPGGANHPGTYGGKDLQRNMQVIGGRRQATKFTEDTHESEHVIGADVLLNKFDGNNVKQTAYKRTESRFSPVVNRGLAYFEKKSLHSRHIGTRTQSKPTNPKVIKFGGATKVYRGGTRADITAGNIGDAVMQNQMGYALDWAFTDYYGLKEEFVPTHAKPEPLPGDPPRELLKGNALRERLNEINEIDKSYYTMFQAKDILYLSDRNIPVGNPPVFDSIPITDRSRLKMLIGRFAATNGRYPSIQEVMETIDAFDLRRGGDGAYRISRSFVEAEYPDAPAHVVRRGKDRTLWDYEKGLYDMANDQPIENPEKDKTLVDSIFLKRTQRQSGGAGSRSPDNKNANIEGYITTLMKKGKSRSYWKTVQQEGHRLYQKRESIEFPDGSMLVGYTTKSTENRTVYGLIHFNSQGIPITRYNPLLKQNESFDVANNRWPSDPEERPKQQALRLPAYQRTLENHGGGGVYQTEFTETSLRDGLIDSIDPKVTHEGTFNQYMVGLVEGRIGIVARGRPLKEGEAYQWGKVLYEAKKRVVTPEGDEIFAYKIENPQGGEPIYGLYQMRNNELIGRVSPSTGMAESINKANGVWVVKPGQLANRYQLSDKEQEDLAYYSSKFMEDLPTPIKIVNKHLETGMLNHKDYRFRINNPEKAYVLDKSGKIVADARGTPRTIASYFENNEYIPKGYKVKYYDEKGKPRTLDIHKTWYDLNKMLKDEDLQSEFTQLFTAFKKSHDPILKTIYEMGLQSAIAKAYDDGHLDTTGMKLVSSAFIENPDTEIMIPEINGNRASGMFVVRDKKSDRRVLVSFGTNLQAGPTIRQFNNQKAFNEWIGDPKNAKRLEGHFSQDALAGSAFYNGVKDILEKGWIADRNDHWGYVTGLAQSPEELFQNMVHLADQQIATDADQEIYSDSEYRADKAFQALNYIGIAASILLAPFSGGASLAVGAASAVAQIGKAVYDETEGDVRERGNFGWRVFGALAQMLPGIGKLGIGKLAALGSETAATFDTLAPRFSSFLRATWNGFRAVSTEATEVELDTFGDFSSSGGIIRGTSTNYGAAQTIIH